MATKIRRPPRPALSIRFRRQATSTTIAADWFRSLALSRTTEHHGPIDAQDSGMREIRAAVELNPPDRVLRAAVIIMLRVMRPRAASTLS